jgi:hypothetical protein
MKQLFFTISIMLVTSGMLFGQTDEKSARQALEKYLSAIKNKDAASVDQMMSDNFKFRSSCIELNKAQRMESIKSGLVKYDAYKAEDMKFYLSNQGALIVIPTKVSYRSEKCNQEYTVSNAYISFLKIGDQLQLSAECAGNNCTR